MRNKGEPFFFYMTIGLILVVVSGFSVLAFQRPGGPLATPLYLHVHGGIFLSWFLLLAVQSRLASRGTLDLHRKLGRLSIVLACIIVLVGYFVIRMAVHKPGFTIAGRPAVFGAVFPIFDMITFSIAYSLGILFRRRMHAHKRFMLISAVMMIDPAVARLVLGLGGPGSLILVLELSIFVVMLTYDVARLQRPHWATLVGLGLYLGAFVVKRNVETIVWWQSFMSWAF